MEKEKKVHYVDNKQFFAEMEKWKTEIEESDQWSQNIWVNVFIKLPPIYRTGPILSIIPIVRK